VFGEDLEESGELVAVLLSDLLLVCCRGKRKRKTKRKQRKKQLEQFLFVLILLVFSDKKRRLLLLHRVSLSGEWSVQASAENNKQTVVAFVCVCDRFLLFVQELPCGLEQPNGFALAHAKKVREREREMLGCCVVNMFCLSGRGAWS
jgi:hypothetical protein